MKTTTIVSATSTTGVPGGIPKRLRDEDLTVLDAYVDHLRSKPLSDSSVINQYKSAKRFIAYLSETNKPIIGLGRCNIADYWIEAGKKLSHRSMVSLRYNLAPFLSFLAAIDATSEDLSVALPAVSGRTTRIKSFYSDEEVLRVLEAIDRETAVGKRDYAMILLVSTTALRTLDIIQLEISDIDWESSCITLVLHKNRRLHTIPLLASVGNAILDYLLNARPDSDSRRLFLSACPPYRDIDNSSTCSGMLKSRLKRAGVDVAGRSQGFHVFRVRAASMLLAEGTPLANISNFLGHRSPGSIKPYLSVDSEGLRSCCLPLCGIEFKGHSDPNSLMPYLSIDAESLRYCCLSLDGIKPKKRSVDAKGLRACCLSLIGIEVREVQVGTEGLRSCCLSFAGIEFGRC